MEELLQHPLVADASMQPNAAAGIVNCFSVDGTCQLLRIVLSVDVEWCGMVWKLMIQTSVISVLHIVHCTGSSNALGETSDS